MVAGLVWTSTFRFAIISQFFSELMSQPWPVSPFQLNFPLAQTHSYATFHHLVNILLFNVKRNLLRRFIKKSLVFLINSATRGGLASKITVNKVTFSGFKSPPLDPPPERHNTYKTNVYIDHDLEHNKIKSAQNRRQKVVNRGALRVSEGFTFVQRGLTFKFDKKTLLCSVSYFSVGSLELFWGAKPSKAPPVATGLSLHASY